MVGRAMAREGRKLGDCKLCVHSKTMVMDLAGD
jgi:hypothetical protein